MPLSGIVCCRTGEIEPVESCLQCAATGEPEECVYPLPLLKSIAGNEASRKGAGQFSATTLQGCARQVILMREVPYAEDPQLYLPRFFGTLGHDTMYQELKDDPNAIAEIRFHKEIEINGTRYDLSGKMDWVLPQYQGQGLVVDFKNAGKPVASLASATRDEHEWQAGGIYPWLLWGGTPDEVTEAMGDYLDSDGHVHIPIGLAEIDYFYTGSPRQVKKIKIPVKTFAETEAYIRERMFHHVQYAEEDVLPPVLPSTYKFNKRTGETTEIRHWMCNRCPVRAECDFRAALETQEGQTNAEIEGISIREV